MQATYTHDDLGRLTKIVFSTGEQVDYTYDAVGNRTLVSRIGSLGATDGDPSIAQVRVSLTEDDPWGHSDVTDGSYLFIEPVYDSKIGIWNGTETNSLQFSGFSIDLDGLSAGNYRLYVYDNDYDAVVESAELVAWPNSSTPPSDTLVSDGYYVKASSTNRRAIADIMIHSTGKCDWRTARRGICHLDERMRRPAILTAIPSENSWNVAGSTAWRRVNSGGTIGEHYVEFILPNSTYVCADAMLYVKRGGGTGTFKYQLGLGFDVTNIDSSTQPFGFDQGINAAHRSAPAIAKFKGNVAAGMHTLSMIEQNLDPRIAVAYGDNNDPSTMQPGMLVEIAM